MKRLFAALSVISVLTLMPLAVLADNAATNAPTPTLEQRVAGLEAYVLNGDPTAALKGNDGKIPAGLTVPVAGMPGPGPNAWQMASAALVLFMTLPGLALFYGGLVRRKNVLSVMAQCFFITGLVTILWWICGYSMVFAKGNSFMGLWGGFDKMFLKG